MGIGTEGGMSPDARKQILEEQTVSLDAEALAQGDTGMAEALKSLSEAFEFGAKVEGLLPILEQSFVPEVKQEFDDRLEAIRASGEANEGTPDQDLVDGLVEWVNGWNRDIRRMVTGNDSGSSESLGF
jgi:hypothetical protein